MVLRFSEYCQLMTEEFFQKIITGSVAPVKTLGIITAYNPDEKTLTKIGNERKNKNLEEDLNKAGFAPIPMKGRFWGKPETSFLVINVDRSTLVDLAKKYNQHAVIFGQKDEKKSPFDFSFIVNGVTVRKGRLGTTHPKNEIDRDCYFQLSGEKFNIHFNK